MGAIGAACGASRNIPPDLAASHAGDVTACGCTVDVSGTLRWGATSLGFALSANPSAASVHGAGVAATGRFEVSGISAPSGLEIAGDVDTVSSCGTDPGGMRIVTVSGTNTTEGRYGPVYGGHRFEVTVTQGGFAGDTIEVHVEAAGTTPLFIAAAAWNDAGRVGQCAPAGSPASSPAPAGSPSCPEGQCACPEGPGGCGPCGDADSDPGRPPR
jgi:hypothetical protein